MHLQTYQITSERGLDNNSSEMLSHEARRGLGQPGHLDYGLGRRHRRLRSGRRRHCDSNGVPLFGSGARFEHSRRRRGLRLCLLLRGRRKRVVVVTGGGPSEQPSPLLPLRKYKRDLKHYKTISWPQYKGFITKSSAEVRENVKPSPPLPARVRPAVWWRRPSSQNPWRATGTPSSPPLTTSLHPSFPCKPDVKKKTHTRPSSSTPSG